MSSKLSETGRDLMLRAMISMAAADGRVDGVESVTVSAIFEKVAGESVTEDSIASVAADIKRGDRTLTKALESAAGDLDKVAKDGIVRAAYLVLVADGKVAPPERTRLLNIGRALDMPEDDINTILDGASD